MDKGLLHRAVTIFITNPQGEVFLQKRASNLPFYPGRWSGSCGGHVTSGETYAEGARRELAEELGIECELRELGKFLTPKWKIGNGIEWEFITVYQGTSSAKIMLNDESEEGRFVPIPELKKLLATQPDALTPDLIIASKYFFEQPK